MKTLLFPLIFSNDKMPSVFQTLIRKPLFWILALTLLAFSPAFFAQFVFFDDDLHIFRNSNLVLPLLQSLETIWTETYRGFYIPITYSVWTLLSHFTQALFNIPNLENIPATLFHAFSLFLHLVNISLVAFVLKDALGERRTAILLGTLLFAVHPLQVEAVVWSTGLKDVLSTFFCLAAFGVILKFGNSKVSLSIFLSTLLFIAALLSKPSVIVVPLLAGSYIFFLKKPTHGKLLPLFLIWLLVAVPFAFLTRKLQPQSLLLDFTPLYARPLIALDSLTFYLRKLVIPFGLILDYSRTPLWVLKNPWTYFYVSVFLVLVSYFVKRRFWKALLFLIMFSISILPVMGFVPFAFQNFSTVADHYLYLPMTVVAFFAAHAIRFEVSNKSFFSFALILVALSFWQSTFWLNTKRLLSYTLSKNPKSIIAHNNLAVEYENEGNLERSLKHYQIAARINPRLNHHHYNIGNTLLKMGRTLEARESFEKTLQVDPKYADAHFSLGLIAESEKKLTEALKHFQKAIELEPFLGKAGIKLGTILVQLGHIDQGIEQIQYSITLDPRTSPQGYYHLGTAYLAKKDSVRAKEAFEQCLYLNPSYEVAREKLAELN